MAQATLKGSAVEKVSVLLASSHKGLLQTLRKVLERVGWISVVGTSVSTGDTLEKAKALTPEVVVIDLALAGKHLETGRSILKANPQAKVIVLTAEDYMGAGEDESEAGALPADSEPLSLISKQSSPAVLLKSISAARKRRLH